MSAEKVRELNDAFRTSFSGRNAFAQRFLEGEPAERFRNFLRIIAGLWTKDDAAFAPNRRGHVTGACPPSALLPPWFRARHIDFRFRFRISCPGPPRRAHGHDHIVDRLRPATILD